MLLLGEAGGERGVAERGEGECTRWDSEGQVPVGFQTMFCCLFLLMDSTFDLLEAGYMDFPDVLKKTKERFGRALAFAGSGGLAALEKKVRQKIAKDGRKLGKSITV